MQDNTHDDDIEAGDVSGSTYVVLCLLGDAPPSGMLVELIRSLSVTNPTSLGAHSLETSVLQGPFLL